MCLSLLCNFVQPTLLFQKIWIAGLLKWNARNPWSHFIDESVFGTTTYYTGLMSNFQTTSLVQTQHWHADVSTWLESINMWRCTSIGNTTSGRMYFTWLRSNGTGNLSLQWLLLRVVQFRCCFYQVCASRIVDRIGVQLDHITKAILHKPHLSVPIFHLSTQFGFLKPKILGTCPKFSNIFQVTSIILQYS